MKKNRSAKIVAVIGAVTLSCSIFPANPSAMTTHAAAAPTVAEPPGPSGYSPDTPGSPANSGFPSCEVTDSSNSRYGKVPTPVSPNDSHASPESTPMNAFCSDSSALTETCSTPVGSSDLSNQTSAKVADTTAVPAAETPERADSEPANTTDGAGSLPVNTPDTADNGPAHTPDTTGEASAGTPDISGSAPTGAPGVSDSNPTGRPDVSDTDPVSTPDADDSSPATTPDADDSYPATTPDADDSYPATTPDADDSSPATTPDADDNYPASTPDADDSSPATTPDADDSNPASTPDADDSKPASTPDADDSNPASTPDADDSKPADSPDVPGHEPTDIPDVPDNKPAGSPEVPDSKPAASPDVPGNGPSAAPTEVPGSTAPPTEAPDGNGNSPSEMPVSPDTIPADTPGASGNTESASGPTPESTVNDTSNDQQKPEISYERIQKEDGQYAHITVTDPGNTPSGIKECRITMDGAVLDEVTLSMYTLPNEQSPVLRQEFEIPLEGDALHEIQIEVTDNAGNCAGELISMRAVNDVLEIIMPTSFPITIWPYDEEGRQIYSSDVVICNQSNFPVDVNITNISLAVNHSLPDDFQGEEGISKDCKVDFRLRCMNTEPMNFLLTEGNNENIADFSLSARQEGTDSQSLLQMQTIDSITSPDFAVFSLLGTVSEGSEMTWLDGDLKVKVTFEFHRQSEEPSEE